MKRFAGIASACLVVGILGACGGGGGGGGSSSGDDAPVTNEAGTEGAVESSESRSAPSSYSLRPGVESTAGCAPGLVWYNGITELQMALASGDRAGVQALVGNLRDALAELAFAALPPSTAESVAFGKLFASGVLARAEAAEPSEYPEVLAEFSAQLVSPEVQAGVAGMGEYFASACGLGGN